MVVQDQMEESVHLLNPHMIADVAAQLTAIHQLINVSVETLL